MKTIVDKLNEKAVELGSEGNAKTVVEALNEITLASGGNPTATTVADAIRELEFGGGGGVTNTYPVTLDNRAIDMNIKWSSAFENGGFYASTIANGATLTLSVPLTLSSSVYKFAIVLASTANIPVGKKLKITSTFSPTTIFKGSNEGGQPLDIAVHCSGNFNLNHKLTFTLVDA